MTFDRSRDHDFPRVCCAAFQRESDQFRVCHQCERSFTYSSTICQENLDRITTYTLHETKLRYFTGMKPQKRPNLPIAVIITRRSVQPFVNMRVSGIGLYFRTNLGKVSSISLQRKISKHSWRIQRFERED